MDHTRIVTAEDLSCYADRNDSRGVIPELVYLLVRQAMTHGDDCRIPCGDSVNQPGLDGYVKCKTGFYQFVPQGCSYWEIGTGGNPQNKATMDFRKRTTQISVNERQNTTFVFVTPRSSGSDGWDEAKQRQWLNRRKNKGWKDLRIIDGVKLADWLRECPSIARWLAVKMGIAVSSDGMTTPLEHWHLILDSAAKEGIPLPPDLFVIDREDACNELEKLFLGGLEKIFLLAESEGDVNDFVAAYIAKFGEERSHSHRCLFINDINAWQYVSNARSPHVLVANPRLELTTTRYMDLQTEATRNGHGVVIPLGESILQGNAKIVKLRNPSPSKIEKILRDANFSETRAKELAGICSGGLVALRRHLIGSPSAPKYTTGDIAYFLGRLALISQWDTKNLGDLEILKHISGNDLGEWKDKLHDLTLQPDTPLTQMDGKWRFVSRGETWSFLGNRLSDEDLEHFQEIAFLVLGERDPKFDLPNEERYAANVLGKKLKYSARLRKGIAETLALMGSRPEKLEQCSHGKAEAVAARVVHNLLHEADWERWAELGTLMPLLAEAAPKAFLDAVEEALEDLENTPFHAIFMQEGDGLFGGNYMTGLLWSLECLAWSPDYLSRVAVILADLASIDPGGRYSNRPAQSLADIFLPWHIQTTASLDQRKTAIEVVLKEQPNVGWKLLLSLLPHSLGSTSGCYRPVWRPFIPSDWEDGVSVNEYWAQIHVLAEFAVEMASSDVERLLELTDRLSDLPQKTQEEILNHFASNCIVQLPESERMRVWEKLNSLVRHHRKFRDAQWALPEESLVKIEKIAKSMTPTNPLLQYRYLFSADEYDLYEEQRNYEVQRKCLSEKRQAALSEIMGNGNFARCMDFAREVAIPCKVGQTLGEFADERIESEILPSQLNTEDEVLERVVAGFVLGRFWTHGIPWVDNILEQHWNPQQCAQFLLLLPFQQEIWERALSYLDESHEELYWKHVDAQVGVWTWNDRIVIEKLITYGRTGAAVMCIAYAMDDDINFDPALATHALMAFLENPQEVQSLERYHVIDLIKHLQAVPTVDIEKLYQIEWNFLPWFDPLSGESPVALGKKLASDPKSFAEMIKLAFRSKNDLDDSVEKQDEKKKNIVERAYTLLHNWKHCPGVQEDGTLDEALFHHWITEARRITEETGHEIIAQVELGHVLTYAPKDPDGLWIHKAVASVLNQRDAEKMRRNFMIALMNQRGVYSFSHGSQERELARGYREKAEALDIAGYTRFATAMRELADQYDADAERDERRDPFEDYS